MSNVIQMQAANPVNQRVGMNVRIAMIHKIIKRVTGWHPHSLRHAGATAAYRATRNLRAVQEMLGHSSLATTERYLHITSAERREAALATVIPSPAMLAA